MFRVLAAILFLAIGANLPSPVRAAAPYLLTKTVPVGPPDRWDYLYVDPAARRLYIAHSDRISVLNAETLSPAGEIAGIDGAHGIAVAGGHGYASNGKSGTVSVFDPATFKITKSIPAAPDADGVLYDPASRHVFVINGDSGSLTVIDAATSTLVATIPTGGSLEFGAADGRGHVFVNEAEPGHLLRVDSASNTVTARWDTPGCAGARGAAVDAAAQRAFVSCVNGVMLVLDTQTGRVIATLPIGRGSDAAAYDAKTHRVFSSNGEGTLSVFREADADHFIKEEDSPTAPGARTMAVDPTTGRVFVVSADVAGTGVPRQPGGPPSLVFKPGSVKVLVMSPR